MRIQMPAQVEQIIRKLNENGYEAFAVGGCVRDALLGREPEDWDITTSARPGQVKALFRRTIDTGIQHGTVTVMIGRTGYEVTTYRIDGEYEDGRHPKRVEFTASLLEDLKRRDFTINAMAYSHETGIVDEFGGMADLAAGVIRCVGDPLERFTEDALRILRAIRFSAQLGFTVEAGTWKAITVIAPNLARVSRERIQVELTKTLLSDHPERIREVFETGMSPYISPVFATLPQGRVRIPTTLPRVKYVRWAAFLRCACEQGTTVFDGKMGEATGNTEAAATAVRILKELKMDHDTIARVKTLVSWSGVEPVAEPEAVRRAMAQMEPELWDALTELNEYGAAIRAQTAKIRADGDCLRLSELAVKGKDLIDAGVKPGKEIGAILARMLDHVLAHPEDNERETLLRADGFETDDFCQK